MPILEVRDVIVRFGGAEALSEVSMTLEAGTFAGLIGPNGAGKTTLFNVITGLQRPSAGQVLFDGEDVTRLQAHERARLGVARTFQRLETFGTLSVRDNVLVAAELRARRRGGSARDLAEKLLEDVGIQEFADERTDTLSTGIGRLVELARALALGPRILLLDEPSSGMNDDETRSFGALLKQIAGEGLGILLVEHDVAFVMGHCQQVNVLDFGKLIAVGTADEVKQNGKVRSAYLGPHPEGEQDLHHKNRNGAVPEGGGQGGIAALPRRTTALVATPPANTNRLGDAPAALDLELIRAGYGTINVLDDVSLSVEPGQVVGLLGPNGAGKSTLLKVASGELQSTHGTIRFDGKDVTSVSSDQLARQGLCLIPEGRGVFPNLTVDENLRMASFTGTTFAVIQERSFATFPALEKRRRQTAGTLSGGEQQMLAVARALATNPRVLLLDELSMGLAPMIVSALYKIVTEIAATGVSIIVVEQFVDSIRGVADTAALMLNGGIVARGSLEEVSALAGDMYLGD
jgi:branched-chain amino acid transport system ATP-binding protein